MLTALQRSGGIDALARQAGVEPLQAHSVAKAVLPAMLTALRNASGGRPGLLAEFERRGGAGLAAAVMGVERTDTVQGQEILDGMLGQDSAVLAGIAEQGGASSERLLPLLVMLVGGYVSARAAGHGAGPHGLDVLLGYVT
jgi:hypothetical protein